MNIPIHGPFAIYSLASSLWMHYNDVIMSVMASHIISLATVYSTVYSRRISKKHQSSASLPFVSLYVFPHQTHNGTSLQWRRNEHDSVSNHQPHDCLLKRLFGRRSKKTSKLRVTGLYAGNSPGTGEFPAQRASNAENVSIWWRHHEMNLSSVWIWMRPADVCFSLILNAIHVQWDQMTFEECSARSRYQGQGQVITSHRYCEV